MLKCQDLKNFKTTFGDDYFKEDEPLLRLLQYQHGNNIINKATPPTTIASFNINISKAVPNISVILCQLHGARRRRAVRHHRYEAGDQQVWAGF